LVSLLKAGEGRENPTAMKDLIPMKIYLRANWCFPMTNESAEVMAMATVHHPHRREYLSVLVRKGLAEPASSSLKISGDDQTIQIVRNRGKDGHSTMVYSVFSTSIIGL
jgi:hypothetical protein